ncbi:MAG TPA: hypothetical protein VF255_00680 [Solirubrobacterales bacterium]
MLRIVKLAASTGLVLTLGAVAASAALAAEGHSEVVHTELRGEQHAGEDTESFNAGTVRCSHATYTGTSSSATQTELVVAPAYTGCKAFGFVNTTIDTAGCTYVFRFGAGTATQSGTTSLDCQPGQAITRTGFNCWITIGSQGPLPGVTYTSQGSGTTRDITIDGNITGITYAQHSKSFPGCTNGTFNNGTYTGATTIRGFNTVGEQVGIWVH